MIKNTVISFNVFEYLWWKVESKHISLRKMTKFCSWFSSGTNVSRIKLILKSSNFDSQKSLFLNNILKSFDGGHQKVFDDFNQHVGKNYWKYRELLNNCIQKTIFYWSLFNDRAFLCKNTSIFFKVWLKIKKRKLLAVSNFNRKKLFHLGPNFFRKKLRIANNPINQCL